MRHRRRDAIVGAVALCSAAMLGKVTDSGSAFAADPRANELAATAREILSSNCYRCHGKEGAAEGGLNFILRRDKLISAKYIVPNRPADSLLAERIQSVDDPMPPPGEMPRPTPHDIETIVGWINAGAPDFGPIERAGFVSNEQVYKGLRADLGRVRKNDAKFMRYLTVMHLRMSGLSDDEIETYRLALSKLLNSLSWNRRLVALTPIDKYKTVFRIDLRDLKWTAAIWDSIAASYPYIQIIDSREAIGCRTITECDVPLPATLVLLILATAGWCLRRGRAAYKVLAAHQRRGLVNNSPS